VEWQVSTGTLDGAGNPIYQAISAEADTTRGLTQEGVVRLRVPKDTTSFADFTISDPNQAGTRDLPPVLDDTRAALLLFWIRAFRKDGTRFGGVQYVVANGAQVWQSRKANPEFLGTGNGQADQSYSLINSPALDNTLILQVEEPSGWVQWNEVDGFYASAPDARDYTLDLEAGTVSFGNGVQGYPPQIGQRIRALEYRYGGGAAGNAAPGAISTLPPTAANPALATVKVNNDLSAHGGADSEAIADALDRIPGELRRRDRAVTASDFEELALETPGAAVGRADCLPLFYPPTFSSGKAGVVSVVVWPQNDPEHPNAPVPDKNLLNAVCAYLDQRRLVTTELYVIPPTYRKVAVAVGLEVKAGFGVEAVRRWVELVIRQYLAPLPPYGPDGKGWPLGRRVFGPELQAAALQVEGVDFLEGLDVAGWDPVSQDWMTGTVNLNDWEVPELAEITVVDGPQLQPGKAIGPLPPPSLPIPIPIIREVC
jgi:predicted phage baseplate assembly protein